MFLKVWSKVSTESWLEKLFLQGKWKCYKKLVLGDGFRVGVNKVPIQNEYEVALKGDSGLSKIIVNLSAFIELAYKDLILSVTTSSSV